MNTINKLEEHIKERMAEAKRRKEDFERNGLEFRCYYVAMVNIYENILEKIRELKEEDNI